MKKTTTIIVLVISILLVGLYTVTSTYSVIIEVIEKDGAEINIVGLLEQSFYKNDNRKDSEIVNDDLKVADIAMEYANTGIIALKELEENSQKGIHTVIYPVGQKAISGFRHKTGDFELRDGYTSVANEPTATGSSLIAEDIANDYVAGKIDKIDIINRMYVIIMRT